MMKKYTNKEGYEIRATEKAYKLFYEKQGFLPVESKAAAKKTKPLEKKSIDEIKTALLEAGVDFPENAEKKDLLELLKKQQEG